MFATLPARLFISCALADVPFRDVLIKHLALLRRRGIVSVWHEGLLTPGSDSETVTRAALEEAHIIVLLLSADFIASRWCWEVETIRAIERADLGETHVFPVLVRAMHTEDTEIGRILRSSRDREVIDQSPNPDRVWADLVAEIQTLIDGDAPFDGQGARGLLPDVDNLDDFRLRVERVCRLREHGCTLERVRAPAPFFIYWEVARTRGPIIEFFPVAAVDGTADPKTVTAFTQTIDNRYREENPRIYSRLVYKGDPAPEGLVESAIRSGVELKSIAEHEGLIDFNKYITDQTTRLRTDAIYPPNQYIDQKSIQIEPTTINIPNALHELLRVISSREPQFVLILADFGTGKTFLLHELARRMGETRSPVVPLLIELRDLEKAHSLDELLGAHLIQRGMRQLGMDSLHYMMEAGQIALLFDGFDELAQRVTYDRAAEHLETLLDAARGHAKVIVTSRTQHFINDAQVKSALARRAERIPYRRIIKLLPFSLAEIRAFLLCRLGDDREAEHRLRLLDEVKNLLGLSQNPRMLNFIVDIDEAQLREARDRRGSITAAALYELLMERWIGREFWRGHPRGAPPGLDTAGRWKATIVLAERLWSGTERSLDLTKLDQDTRDQLTALAPADQEPGVTLQQAGAGTFLCRDEEGKFSFLHRSVMEFAVAWSAAAHARGGKETHLLTAAPMSPLMADFFVDLATAENAVSWAQACLEDERSEIAKKNARLILDRLHVVPRTRLVLRGHQLRGQDFSKRDLTRADFANADLTEAVFQDTQLTEACLSNARLTRADFKDARLSGADVRWADLSFACLRGADLRGARLGGAILRYADGIGSLTDGSTFEKVDTFGAALSLPPAPEFGTLPPARECNAVAASPDGALIVGGYRGGTLVVWNANTGQPIRVWGAHGKPIRAVAFSPHGSLIASGSDDPFVRLWDTQSGECLQTIEAHPHGAQSLTFSVDGSSVASGSVDNSARVSRVGSGKSTSLLRGNSYWMLSVAINADGTLLACGTYEGQTLLWDIRGARAPRILAGHSPGVRSVAFAPDGSLITGCDGGTLRIWNPHNEKFTPLKGHSASVRAVAISHDGTVLASAEDSRVFLWDPRKARCIHEIAAEGTRCLAFDKSAQMLIGGGQDGISIWDVRTGQLLRTLRGNVEQVSRLAFDDSAGILSATTGSRTRIWNAHTATLLRIQEGKLCTGPYGTRSTWTEKGGYLTVIDPSGKKLATDLPTYPNSVREVALSLKRGVVACRSDDGFIRFWSTITRGFLRSLNTHARALRGLAMSADEELLVIAASDVTLRVVDLATGQVARELEGHGTPTGCMVLSADRRLLAVCSGERFVDVWDLRSGELLCALSHDNVVYGLAFSPDARLLISGAEDRKVRVWNARSGELVRSLEGHAAPVKCVAIAADGAILASGSDDNTIRLWSIVSGECKAVLYASSEDWVACAPNGRYKASGDLGGSFWHTIGLVRFEAGELDRYYEKLQMDREELVVRP